MAITGVESVAIFKAGIKDYRVWLEYNFAHLLSSFSPVPPLPTGQEEKWLDKQKQDMEFCLSLKMATTSTTVIAT